MLLIKFDYFRKIFSKFSYNFRQLYENQQSTHFYKKLIYKKLVVGWPTLLAKKLSVLKSQRLINFFFSFSYHNFEDTVTNFDKDMFRKEYFCGTNSKLNLCHPRFAI